MDWVASSARDATRYRCERPWQFQRSDFCERWNHLDLVSPRREIHGAHRWLRRCDPRLRDRVHVRNSTAPAVSYRDARGALASARDRLGQPTTGARWAAMVFSQPE